MKKLTAGIISLLFIMAACSQDEQEPHREAEKKKEKAPVTAGPEPAVIAENLSAPWSITKKGSTFYISERDGAIVSIDQGNGDIKRLPVQFRKKILNKGEGGFLGLELLPETDLEALAYHTYEENGEILNRLIRIKKEQDGWVETDALLEGIPGSHIHNGGRIKIGPDGKLYVTTGDAASPELSQDADSLAGKILRINLDGSIPEDNPFPHSPVYSYGHRNPQGLAWDENGTMYASEHGSDAHDELNKIEPGKNYGWPVIRGDEKRAGMESPIFHTNGVTWAPSGIAYRNGSLYIAALRGEAVFEYELENDQQGTFQEGHGRTRDVRIEGDALFFITNNTDGRGIPAETDDRLLKVNLN